MGKLTIIIESPGRDGEADLLDSKVFAGLALHSGLTSNQELLRRARVITLLGFEPDYGNFPLQVGSLLARSVELGPTNLFVGLRTANCFGYGADRGFLTWRELSNKRRFAIYPHPITDKYWWNDADNKQRATKFIRQLFSK